MLPYLPVRLSVGNDKLIPLLPSFLLPHAGWLAQLKKTTGISNRRNRDDGVTALSFGVDTKSCVW